MKKFFLILATIMMVMFTSCEFGASTNSSQNSDSAVVVVDTAIPVKDTILVNIDTIHCVAVTKTGTQCKNHRIAGDTLCVMHRKLRK